MYLTWNYQTKTATMITNLGVPSGKEFRSVFRMVLKLKCTFKLFPGWEIKVSKNLKFYGSIFKF